MSGDNSSTLTEGRVRAAALPLSTTPEHWFCGGCPMAKDARDLLEVLKFELNFLEQGGYGRSVKTPWKPTSIFEDSLTCLNHGDPAKSVPCDRCLLYDFVPRESQNESVPCHHIPLTDSGKNLEQLDRGYNQQEMEEAVIGWLRRTIDRLERERMQQRAAG